MARKSAYDLKNNPQAPPVRNIESIPPVNIVLDDLSTEGGKRLQLLTRSNPAMVKAARVAFFYSTQILGENGYLGIQYANEHLDMGMRFAVSQDGEGRKEEIECVKAGGDLPSEYYDSGSGGRQYSEVEDE